MTTTIPAGWKLVPIEPTETMVVCGFESRPDPVFSSPEEWEAFAAMTGCQQAAHKARLCYAAMLAEAPAAPGVSTVEDERQAFEAWAKGKKMPLARIGQQYDDFWVDHAWNGWQARAALDAPAAGDALDAARWRAYAAQFPEISAAFLAVHAVDGGDPLPTIKGASITGGYVVVTPAGWDADKATKLRDAILRLFPVNPVHTPRPSDELAAQRKGDA